MQTHNPRADHHILSSWVSHWLILRADGKVNNSKRHFMDHFTNQTKMVSRVTEEYFIKDKAYFPFPVKENHWITVLMHNKKKEFQVLNSTGECSKRVLSKIAKLRAEIANDTKEANALIGTEHPDVSSWPIREYDMPLQKDGVSCGLFVVKCVQTWDRDDWTFEFDQYEVNASRGRILAEIFFQNATRWK
ncbi:ubiquitin-like-specific protease 1A [Triticum aestivum]|uniref:ubiquitin-like-specific protease 1A n=1 Tax=Triticum aestivum TaxID=4565 RepID=UPI001D00E659|nr:ubiquitin-like-specific protease 1A [Triticum aestivum]